LVFTGNTASGFSDVADAGFFLYESGLEYSGPGGSLTGNTANGNLYGFATQDASGFTFKDNTANSNTQYGFVDYTYGPGTLGLGNTYISNSCTGNGSYGSYDGYLGFGPAYLCTPQG